MKYLVEVAGRTVEVELDVQRVRVDGVEVEAHLADLPGTPISLLTLGDSVHRVAVTRGSARGQYALSVDGWRYEAGALDGATGWKAFWHITWPNLHAVVSITLMLGVIYTLKVIDIILGLTQGGPANATQTIATQSYQRSFVEFKFGQGAALSNILILISLVFAIVYLRATRRQVDE